MILIVDIISLGFFKKWFLNTPHLKEQSILHFNDLKLKDPNDFSFIYKNHVLKYFNGTYWIKLFYHNSENGDYWTQGSSKLLTCNEINRYSILNELNLHKYEKKEGKFEFLLDYPEHYPQFNRWKQKINPLLADSSMELGYEPVYISWIVFMGALKPRGYNTFLTCTTGNNWHFAIGSYIHWGNVANSFPAGYTDFSNHENGVQKANLWIKATNEDIPTFPFSIKKMKQRFFLRKIFFFHFLLPGNSEK